MRKIALFTLVLAILTSCSVTETLTINKNGGSSSSDIQVEQFFVDVLEDFAEFLPSDESIMDSAMSGFSKDLDKATSTTSVSFKKTGENHYKVDFDYTSLTALINELGGSSQTLFKESSNSISFYVDINNFEELTKIVPFLADPNFEVYGPLYNKDTTEEDYLDMIYFLLGEDGPDAIRNGKVIIDIKVPGTITTLKGATKVNSTTARFTFPIIDFLLLSHPLTFEINWR